MLCEKCGKRTATTHIKTNINGKITQHHLCGQCAAESGYNQPMGLGMGLGMTGLLGSLFGDLPETSVHAGSPTRCEGCGMSFDEIAHSGKVGCDRCYTTFYDEMLPSLQRIHGKSSHNGKVPRTASPEVKKESRLEKLKAELSSAVAAQEFEKAAQLRDEINQLEANGND
jgi:protein arginine kinase activator